MRRQIKQTADFCRWSIYLTVVIAAVTLVVARLLVNQLYLYEENIEHWLSSAMLTDVDAQTTRGEWLGLFPVVHLEQLRVGDTGQPAVTAGWVRAEPNYLQSFQHANAIWEDLRVRDLRLELVQTERGGWTLRGLAADSGSGAAAFGQLLEMFFRSRLIRIEGLQVNLNFRNGRSLTLDFGELVAQNDDNFHRLRLQAEIQGAANRLTYLVELEGDASRPEQMQGAGFLSLAGADVGGIVDVLVGDLIEIDNASPMPASGSLWFDFNGAGSLTGEGHINIRQFALPGAEPLALEAVLRLQSSSADNWQMRLEQIALQAADLEMQLQQLGLERQGQTMQLTAAGIELAELDQWLASLDMLPQQLQSARQALQPSGQVRALQLEIPLDSRSDWRVTANLHQADLQSWQRAPAVENLSGYLDMTAAAGRFVLDGENTRVAFAHLFDQPLLHERLNGEIYWQLDHRNASLLLYSSRLSSAGAYGEANSQFRLLTPVDGSFASDFSLVSGLRNGSLADWPAFVPMVAETQLLDWMGQSDMQGLISQAGFVYRGKLRESLSQQRRIELVTQLESAVLNFAEGWPPVSSLQGQFELSDGQAMFQGDSGFLVGIELESLSLDIANNRLQLQSDSRADLSNYQGLLMASPQAAQFDQALAPLVLAGPARASLELQLPLDRLEAAEVDVQLRLQGNQLLVPRLDLAVESIQGDLHYGQGGLSSSDLTGQIWGQSYSGVLSQQGDRVSLALRGSLELQALENWPALPLPPGFSGKIDLTGQLSFAPEPALNQFHFRSDTRGMALDLPGVLSKSAEQLRNLDLVLVDSPRGVAVDLNWGDLLYTALDLNAQGQMTQAAFSVGAPRPSKQQGLVRGHVIVDELDINAWIDYLSMGGSGESWFGADLQPDIAIRSYRTYFSGLDMGPVQGKLNNQGGLTQFAFQSAFGGGRVSLQREDQGYPLRFDWVDLKSLPKPVLVQAGDASTADAGQAYDPSQMPPLQVSVNQMFHGQRPLGQWAFQIEPVDQGARLNRIAASFTGGQIDASDDNYLLWLANGDGGQSTHLQLKTGIANVADLFEMFAQPRAMTSRSGSLELDLDWQGAPWQAELEAMVGQARLNLRQGNFSAEVQGVGSAMMRLVGLVNIQNWGRRLQFDFSDLTGDGTAYDSLNADVQLAEGSVVTNQPINIDLATGRLRLAGAFDLVANRVEGQLIANLPVRDNLTWITGVVAGLPAAAGIWLFGEMFKDELESFARVTYNVSGSLDAPQIEPESAEDI